MTRRAHRTIKQAEQALATAETESSAAPVTQLLDAAASLRHELPSASRNDPFGVVERALARRSNRAAERAEMAAAAVYSRLKPTDQSLLLKRLGSRRRAITASLMSAARSEHRRAALDMLAASGDWSLVPRATSLIGSETPGESEAAVEAIAILASSLSGPVDLEPTAFERAIAAVLDSAAHFGERRGSGATPARGALDLALLMLTPAARAGRFGAAPRRWLSEASQSLELAIRASLRRLPGAVGVVRAFELVAHPGVRRASVERIATAVSNDDLDALLDRAHLGRRPIRRSALRSRLEPDARLRLALRVCERVEEQRQSAVAPSRGLSDFVELLGVPASKRTRSFELALADRDASTRLSAVLFGGDELRLDQALDARAPVALSAAMRIGVPSPRDPEQTLVDGGTRRVLMRSQHAAVRRLAQRMPSEGEISPASRVAVRARLRRDPQRVFDDLSRRIEAGDVVAIELSAHLECADDVLAALEASLRSDDAQVAARSASALGSARSERADALLMRSVEHDEPRVRANSVEALAFRARRWKRSPLVLRLDDAHHRPASTSVRAQLLAGEADERTGERVRDLVSSSEPLRRAAGLWLTERSAAELKPIAGRRWAEIAARVADSARNGATAAELTRATRCARRMLAVSAK